MAVVSETGASKASKVFEKVPEMRINLKVVFVVRVWSMVPQVVGSSVGQATKAQVLVPRVRFPTWRTPWKTASLENNQEGSLCFMYL